MKENPGAEQETHHELTLYAEPLFQVGSFTVTNAYFTSFIALFILVLFFIAAGRKIKRVPKGAQNFFEIVLEGTLDFIDSITRNRKKSEKFLPLILSLFLFILVNNWLGIFPGIGTIGFEAMHDGHKTFVPFLRGGTADLNTTLALAMISVVMIHVLGVSMIGAWNYFNRFINIKAILEIPKKISKEPMVVLLNPIKAFVSLVEIISELSKVISLSLRLFGNIFAGEVLLTTFLMLTFVIIPVPFYFLEVMVGFLQAFIFSMLVLLSITMATSEEH